MRTRVALLAAVLSLAVLPACAGTGAPPPSQLQGATDLLVTRVGVIWTFDSFGSGPEVSRSSDGGRHWRAVFPVTRAVALCGCLTGSWFLGPDDAWVVQVRLLGGGLGNVVRVDGTTDGGRHWFESNRLPGLPSGMLTPLLSAAVTFSDPRNGLVLASGTGPGATSGLVEYAWATSDGGRNWKELPSAALPYVGEDVASPSPCPFDHPPTLRLASGAAFVSAGSCTPAGETPSLFSSGDGGRRWVRVPLPGPPGGWPATVEVGPVVSTAHELLVPVLAGARRLVVERSTNGGRRWQVASLLHLGASSTDPTATFVARTPLTWVVPTGLAMEVTNDGGRSWHVEPSNQFTGSGPVAFGPHLVVALASLGGATRIPALESTDGGRTWTAVGVGEPASERVSPAFTEAVTGFSALSRTDLVAFGPAGLAVSSSGGRSWSWRLEVPVEDADFLGQTGYVVTPFSLARTNDGGRSWTMLREPAQLSSVQFETPSVGLAGPCTGASSPLFITRDGGHSWERVALPLPWSTMGLCEEQGTTSAGAAGGLLWAVAAAGKRPSLFESSDGGRHWSKVLGSPQVPALSLMAVSGRSAWVVVAQPEGPMNTMGQFSALDVLVTTDGGRYWRDVLASPHEQITGLPAGVPNPRPRPLGVPSYPGGPLRSRAVGAGQGLQLEATSPLPGVLWIMSDSQNAQQVRFLVTGNAGRSWTTTGLAPFGAARVVALAASGPHDAVVLVSNAKGAAEVLWATTDGGRTWQRGEGGGVTP